ncbi:MAG: hypothetical protein ABI960_02920 [Candidatus Eisenbacteria bacterium]
MNRATRFAASVASTVVALAFVASTSSAAVLVNEPFTYPDGNLVGNGGWTAHSAAGLMPIQVVSGEAVLDQGSGSREDANVSFSVGQSATAKTYVCFDLTVPPSITGSADYFAHFRNSATFVYPARIYVRPTANTWSVALSASSGGATQFWPSELNYNQKYKIVAAYDASTGGVELWVDPVSEASPKISEVVATVAGDAVNTYALRQGGGSGGMQHVDNLRVGQSFAEACDLPVPAGPATWGAIKASYR